MPGTDLNLKFYPLAKSGRKLQGGYYEYGIWTKDEDADPSLKKDRDYVLAAVKDDGRALQFADPSLMKDRELVLVAIKENGLALKYADESLKKDKEFVLAAVAKDFCALMFADESLFEDEELLAAGGYVEVEEW